MTMEYPQNEKWPEKTRILSKKDLSSGATLFTKASCYPKHCYPKLLFKQQ